MKNNILILIFCLIFEFTFSTPSENGFVVSSTETSKDKVDVVDPDSLSLYPVIYEMNINANISNRFAKTLVVSKVKNSATSAKEVTFTVVLPDKAFISEFVMEIGGKRYKAYVKEKEEAKNIYNQAVATGRSAAHVSVSARDSNRFTVSVNVEPESKAVFFLTYEELLQRRLNQYELVINIHPGQIVKNLDVEIHINESRPLRFVKTPSLRSGNEISKYEEKLNPSADIQIINSTTAVVKFTPDIVKQKQFAQYLGTKESEGLSGQFIVQYDVERDPQGGEVLLQDGYFVHFFAPSDLEPLPKHVVFVLDTSGSMGGRKILQLKDAMNSILDEIRTNDVISLVEFNSFVTVWDINSQKKSSVQYGYEENYHEPYYKLGNINLPSPVVANNNTIQKAKRVIKKINAEGGTHMIGGLETGLYLVKAEQENNANKTEKYQPIIIFLTDGDPNVGISSTEEIVKIVTRLNSGDNKVPIFSLSFGSEADKEFLRKLSLKNLAFSRHIYEASDASLQLQEFYKQISSPLLSDINFKYESEVEKVTKSHFPIYFRGSELVVTGRYTDSTFPTTIRCFGPRGPIILRPTIKKPISSLERLWAYLTVRQTLEERESVDNKTELTKKALDLALKYSFVTDVSSLVVVKPNDTRAVETEEATEGSLGQSGSRRYPLALGSASFPSLHSSYGGGYSGQSGRRYLSAPGSASYPTLQLSHGRGLTVSRNYPSAPISYFYPTLESSYGSGYTYPRPHFSPQYVRPVSASGIRQPMSSQYLPNGGSHHYGLMAAPTSHNGYGPYDANTSNSTHRPLGLVPLNASSTQDTTTRHGPRRRKLENSLPWITSVLNSNRTLTILGGVYELGEHSSITVDIDCPKTPINSTETGKCTLLKKCREVHSYLTDFQIYQQYFCPINNKFAGVCCPKKFNQN